MPQMQGQRQDTIRSLTGHTLFFVKGESIHVPPIQKLVSECLSRGHTILEEEQPEATPEAPKAGKRRPSAPPPAE